jgi:hypothetical protein
MLIEYRKIQFPEKDLMEAIALHDEATSQRLGDGEIVDIEISTGEITEINAKVDFTETDETGSIPLPVSFITAAMIRYCIEEGIPVPKRGHKEIEISDGTLSLVMHMTQGTIADEPDEEESDEESEAA